MTMVALAQTLQQNTWSPVHDKTGLTGRYDLTLELVTAANANGTPGAAPDPSGAAAASAVGKLGLKLVPSRGVMQVLVVESIDRPKGN
jgi:uncharacterized protein (TIGR03435 family)